MSLQKVTEPRPRGSGHLRYFVTEFFSPRRTSLHFFGFFLLILLLLFLRRPNYLINSQFWAEDGKIFFLQQLNFGFWGALIHPFAGYLCVASRIIAGIASLWPTYYAPFVFNISSTIIAGVTCSAFFHRSFRHLVRSDLLRALACVMASVSVYMAELLSTVTNLQWYLNIIAVLMLFSVLPDGDSVASKWGTLWRCVVALIIAFSSPLIVILTPFLIWRFRSERRHRKLWPLVMFAGIVVQFIIFYFHKPHDLNQGISLNGLITGLILAIAHRVILCTAFGITNVYNLILHNFYSIYLLAIVGTTVWLTILRRTLSQQRERLFWIGLYLLIAGTLLPLYGRHYYEHYQSLVLPAFAWFADRYFLFGSFIFIFLVTVTVENSTRITDKLTKAFVLVLVFIASPTSNFTLASLADLNWGAEAAEIDLWRYATSHHLATTGAYVLINPATPWPLIFPCRDGQRRKITVKNSEGCLIAPEKFVPGAPVYITLRGEKRELRSPTLLDDQSNVRLPQDVFLLSRKEFDSIPTGAPL